MANRGGRMPGVVGKTLPHDKVAEQAVLGCILLSNRALEIIEWLDGADFYVDAHRRIYQAMKQVAAAREPIDHVTLGNRLIANGELEKVGGPLALECLTESVSVVSNVESYAQIVRNKAAARRMIAAAQKVLAEGFGEHADSNEWISSAQATIGDVAARALAGHRLPRTLFSYADDVRLSYDQARAGTAGLPLPWPTITNMTGGLRWGTVTCFVARPSVGKSTVAILVAKHVWELTGREERVLVVSPEMSAQDMAERFFVIDAKVPYMSVIRGQLSGFEEPKLWAAMDRRRGEDRLWILDGVADDLTEASVESAIRAVRPTLVAVDSFYDLNFPGRDDNERVRNIARWIYRSCKRHRYAAVVGSQQNRDQEKSKAKGGGSRLGTIAFSDAIGQRFDAIFALERDEKLKQSRRLRVQPLKIRRGYGMQPVELNWDFSTSDFGEVEGIVSEYKGDADAHVPEQETQDRIPFDTY